MQNSSSFTPKQLVFQFCHKQTLDFSTFHPGNNKTLYQQLHQFNPSHPTLIYLWGPNLSGKTHLLTALSHRVNMMGLSCMLIPMTHKQTFSPNTLQQAAECQVICIDDIHLGMGDNNWEMAFFNLYNHVVEHQTSLFITSSQTAVELPIQLADLKSRLSACTPYYVHPLNDEEKMHALVLRATKQGFTLPKQVATYLLNHFDRNLSHLFKLLDQLDQASLSQHKKLSIPFIKQAFTEMNLISS